VKLSPVALLLVGPAAAGMRISCALRDDTAASAGPTIRRYRTLAFALTFVMAARLSAQESARESASDPPGEEVVKMEAFNVTAYNGKIPIIDGFTGKDYRGDNDVVFNFAQSFNKLLIGYHKKLVTDEIKHLQFRIKLGKEFEREMGQLSGEFGFSKFALDDTQWLRRERAIITRLMREPFFQIKALVVWDLERLNQMRQRSPTRNTPPTFASTRRRVVGSGA
jgi:hypothetical protein